MNTRYHFLLLTILFAFGLVPSQAQWTSIPNPKTESIVTVFKDTVSGHYFASSNKRQAYFSTSLNEPWQIIPIDWQYDAYSTAFFHAFIRKGEELFAIPSYVSTDNGLNWSSQATAIGGIAPAVLNDTVYYIESGSAYLYKSTPPNYRVLVNSQLAVAGSGVFRDLVAHKGNLVVAQYRKGLYYSSDNGANFTESTADVSISGFSSDGFYATDSALYISIQNEGSLSHFLKSVDGGMTWTRKGNAAGNVNYGYTYTAGTNGYLFASNYTGLYRSSDEGVTWTKLSSMTALINSLYSIKNELLLATHSGVYISTDNGETFIKKNEGFDGGVDYTSLTKIDSDWYLTTSGGEVFKSEYLKTDWNLMNENQVFPTITKVIPFNEDTYIFAGKAVYKNAKDSSNWVFSEPAGINPSFAFFTANSNNVLFNDTLWSHWSILLGQTGLYTITAETGLTFYPSNFPAGTVTQFLAHDSTLLASIQNQGIWRRFKNNGTWVQLSTNLESMDLINGRLYSINTSENTIYVSDDLGTSWTTFGTLTGSNISSSNVNLLESKGEFYLTQNKSVIAVSLDTTKTWIRNDHPLWDRLYVDKENSIISIDKFLGVFDGTIYGTGADLRHINVNSPIGTSIEETDRTNNPKTISLLNNYPNPFNPSTTIQFELGSSQTIELNVYDMLGRLVSSVFSGKVSAGEHRFQWNAQGLASGMYLFQLKTENKISTRKMMLIK